MAAAAASGDEDELKQNIRDQFLQCKICLDGLKSPKTLPCLHTFCAECIAFYIKHNSIDNRKFVCPICRRHIYIPKNGSEGFPDSFFVSSLSEIMDAEGDDEDGGGKRRGGGGSKGSGVAGDCGICRFKEGGVRAVSLCIECKLELCGDCVAAHTAARITAAHTLVPVTAPGMLRQDNYCRVHKGEVIKFYCETCNSALCLPCTFLEHKGHEVEEIKAVREHFSHDINHLVDRAAAEMLQLTATKDDLLDLENELFVRKESAKADIQRAIQEIIRSINQQKSTLMAEIDDFYDTVAVGRDRQQLERVVSRLERAHGYAVQLLSADTSPITQIVSRQDAKDGLQVALDYSPPDADAHTDKLHRYVSFLPGNTRLQLGSLLKCTGPGSSATVSELVPSLPASHAIYMHKLRVYDEPLGDIIALALTNGGDVVLLTDSDKKVKVFNNSGRIKYEFGTDEELLNPSDIAITREGDIAITDCGHMCVKIFDPYGSLKLKFGENHMSLPISLAVDAIGRLLICDQAKQRVSLHRQHGELIQNVHIAEVHTPTQIRTHANKLFVCDSDHKCIIIYHLTDEEIHFIGKLAAPETCVSGSASFLDCSGIATDRYGNLLIADMALDRVHCLSPRAHMSSIVGRGKPMLRPMCVATNCEGLMAISQHGVFPLEEEMPTQQEVIIYKLLQADV